MNISKTRINFVFLIFVICFAVLSYRNINFQIKPDPRLVNRAKKQFVGTIDLTPKRGDILDKNGRAIAVSRTISSLYAEPCIIENKKELAKKISKELEINFSTVYSKLNNDKYFVWIKRKLSDDEFLKIQDLVDKTRGLNFKKENKRYYPNQTLGSHIVGYVNIDSKGKSGIEAYYDDYLVDNNKKFVYEKDARGRVLLSSQNTFAVTESDNSVFLTIDNSVQYFVERELKDTVEKFKAKSGTVIVINPSNGEIISLANYPNYDPNENSNYDSFIWKNRAITDLYEPGSTFKIFTVAVGLSGGFVKENEIIDGTGGRLLVGTGKSAKYIKEAKGHDYGKMTLSELIAKSSNVGSAKLGLIIGYKNLVEGVKKFGFASKTNLDAVGEVNGKIRAKGGSVDLANIAFGQGLGVTPIQIVKGYSIIANGGYNIQPHFVKKIVDKDGVLVKEHKLNINDRIIDGELAKNLRKMLRMVVEEGTATATDIDGFQIAGKTGTAEKFINGKYSDDKYIASFVGFFPADNPKYTMLTLIDEPQHDYYASVVAVPLFRKVASYIIQNDSISPNNIVATEITGSKLYNTSLENKTKSAYSKNEVPAMQGLSLREVLSLLGSEWEDVEVIGSGKIVKQYPLPGKKDDGSKKITLWLE